MSSRAANVTVEVGLGGAVFKPATTNINAGDQVTWNWDGISHSSTSGTANSTSSHPDGLWDSGIHSSPNTFTHTFPTSGTFPYFCSVHFFEGMTGSIQVAAAASSPPSVSITNPAPNSLFAAPATVTVQATASDPNSGGSITNVQFLVGTSPFANVTSPPFSAVTNNLPAGSYQLTAIASDNVGLKATNSINIVVGNVPTVAITNPTPNMVFAAPANVTIQADATGTVTNVQFLVGASVLANVASAPFSALTNNLPAGSYTLTAIASDNLGLNATNSISILVDVLPTVTITNPAPNAVFSAPATVTIQADAGDSDGSVTNVQFSADGNVLANVTAAPYSAVAPNLAAGTHSLSAIAWDNHGIAATNSISISVTSAVTVALSSPQFSGSTFQFSYSAAQGSTYIVQVSTNLGLDNWTSLSTNTASSSSVVFVDGQATNGNAFYRVELLPNPCVAVRTPRPQKNGPAPGRVYRDAS